MHVTPGELRTDELEDLSVFLNRHLGDKESCFADVDILTWKYFGRKDPDRPVSLVMRDDAGEIVAHCGATYTRLTFPGDPASTGVRAMFPTDWVSCVAGGGVKLMNLALDDTPVLYAIGGTADAGRALRAVRCKLIVELPVMRRFLSARGARLRAGRIGGGRLRRWGRASRDVARTLVPLRPVPTSIRLEPITQLAPADLQAPCAMDAIRCVPSVEECNHLLAHPRGAVTGWRVFQDGRPRGFALVSVLTHRTPVTGKILECRCELDDEEAWGVVFLALSHLLRRLGAEMVLCLGGTPLWEAALGRNRYHRYGERPLHLRYRGGPSLSGECARLTHLQGDLGYA